MLLEDRRKTGGFDFRVKGPRCTVGAGPGTRSDTVSLRIRGAQNLTRKILGHGPESLKGPIRHGGLSNPCNQRRGFSYDKPANKRESEQSPRECETIATADSGEWGDFTPRGHAPFGDKIV